MRYAIVSSLILGTSANLDYLLARMPPSTSISMSPECVSAAMMLQPAPTIAPEYLQELAEGVTACSYEPPYSLSKQWRSYTEAANEWIEENISALKDLKHYCPHPLVNPCPETMLAGSNEPGDDSTMSQGEATATVAVIIWSSGVPQDQDMLSFEEAMISHDYMESNIVWMPEPTTTQSSQVPVYDEPHTGPGTEIIPPGTCHPQNNGVRVRGSAVAVIFAAAIAALGIW